MLEPGLAGTKPPAQRGATIAVRELLQRRAPSLPKKEKIAVRHLNFYYQNGNQALKDISMPIYAESVTALFGPSGCGKSTLIRVFNRIYALCTGQRTEGEVLLDGENILGNIRMLRCSEPGSEWCFRHRHHSPCRSIKTSLRHRPLSHATSR